MKGCNDLELMDSFYFDYLVNYAVGIRTLGEMNLAPRTIYSFQGKGVPILLRKPDEEAPCSVSPSGYP